MSLTLYENWVRSEQGWYLPLLDTLKSFTMFLPGRFNENFLKSEAIYTMFNLLGMYHDSIAGRPRPFELKTGAPTAWVNRAKTLLGVAELSEVLVEMIAGRKFGDQGLRSRFKWLVILGVESFKMLCKIILLHNNRWRMITQLTPEEVKLQLEQQDLRKINHELSVKLQNCPGPFPDLTSMYIDSGRHKLAPHGEFVVASVEQDVPSMEPILPARAASELLYILRPVVYCASKAVYLDSGDWRPLVLSACCDIGSRVLMPPTSDPSELREIQSRNLKYLFYLARSPLFETVVKPPLLYVIAFLAKIPLLGTLLSSILELLISLQPHYFYTSASS